MKAYYFPEDYDIWFQKASKGERAFYDQCAALGFIPSHGEAQVIEDRKWRFDFLFDWADLVVEIEGGVFSGGRHTRPVGFSNDCLKYNRVVVEGYVVMRFTTEQVMTGQAQAMLKDFIDNNTDFNLGL